MTTTPQNIRVGGEIDAFCTKCEMNLAATILAMVGPKVARVRCNTCGTDRAYRGEQPLVAAQSFARKREPKAKKDGEAPTRSVTSWAARVESKDPSTARKYDVKAVFKVDDLVDHPSFGLGIVSAVRGDKMDVAFKAFEKTLLHAKGAPAAPLPPPPKKNSSLPTSTGVSATRLPPGPSPEKDELKAAPPAPAAAAPEAAPAADGAETPKP